MKYAAIMAGGVGSRFWPASRERLPKQFLDILGIGKSLLQMTYARFEQVIDAENIFIVTNEKYVDLVSDQLPDIDPSQIIAEPSRNNTAPCIAYTAMKLKALDHDANLVVAPSDHIILDEAAFIEDLMDAFMFTEANKAIVTMGISPTRPDTGYGYIHYEQSSVSGVHKVRQFTEKPNLEKAEAFLSSGDYLWNAGIFVFHSKTILEAFQTHAPDIHSILSAGEEFYNTPSEAKFISENYPLTPKISIDYAIMEKANNIYTIPSRFSWSDLGTWASLHAESEKDEQGNTLFSHEIIALDTANTIIRSPHHKLVVVKGLQNFIVVDEQDVLLIFPKSEEQQIKKITQTLKEKGKHDFL